MSVFLVARINRLALILHGWQSKNVQRETTERQFPLTTKQDTRLLIFLVCDKRKNCLIDQPTVYGELVSHENVDGGNRGPLSIQASDGFIFETVNKVGNC